MNPTGAQKKMVEDWETILTLVLSVELHSVSTSVVGFEYLPSNRDVLSRLDIRFEL
jgi:hypothetical protein